MTKIIVKFPKFPKFNFKIIIYKTITVIHHMFIASESMLLKLWTVPIDVYAISHVNFPCKQTRLKSKKKSSEGKSKKIYII